MRKFWVTFCLVLLTTFSPLLAQDFINLFCDVTGAHYINTEVSAGYTFFSLSKASGTPISGLQQFNNKVNANLDIGERLKIVIAPQKIITDPTSEPRVVPLYYTVKKGDNLYRIASRLKKSSATLMDLNGKSHSALEIDEKILVGYIKWSFTVDVDSKYSSITQFDKIGRAKVIQPLSTRMSPDHISIPRLALATDTSRPPQIVTEKGIAYWEKVDYSSHELIVMHPFARVNSKISLYNPMLDRMVDAKVVSELPREAYPKDISVVISPSVANALGALDKRFLVEITYVE